MSALNTGNTAPITETIGFDLSSTRASGGDGAAASEAVLGLPPFASVEDLSTELQTRRALAEAEMAGVLVNRSRNDDGPFVPIVKTPTHSQNSGNLTGYAVEIADPRRDSGFRHVGNVSESYLLMNNLDVRRLALEVANRTGLGYKEAKAFWDGSRFLHVIEFDKTEDVVHGDPVALSLITKSSYDKSWRFDMAIGAIRLACLNGMISGTYFNRVTFKHVSGQTLGSGLHIDEGTWEQTVLQGLSIMERSGPDLSRFVRGLRRLHGAEMTDALLRDVWQHVPKLGDGLRGKIMERYLTSEDPTLYGLFNGGTNVLWHNDKQTAADFNNNDAWTTAMLDYAFENVN
jgi:hypothetical protein